MESEIKITLGKNGEMQLAITGAAQANVVVALGMLDLAGKMLAANNANAAKQSPIVQARAAPGNGVLLGK
jgi:hypothetical protein